MIDRASLPIPRAATLAALIVLQLSALLGAPGNAEAQRIVHRVRFGETYATIAARYYGTKEHARFIALVNGVTLLKGTQAVAPQAGERLRVPTAWVYLVPRATSVSVLGARLLGDRRRAAALVAFNRLRGRARRVRAKTRLVVPFNVSHQVSPGETFAAISTRYYGNTARAKLVAQYNGLRGAQPPARTSLEIPIARVRVTAERLLQLTNHRLLGVSPARQQVDRAALQEANGMLRRGDYWRVPLRLVRLLAREQPSDTYTAEVYKLLATAYVALNQPEQAVRAFKEALLRQPTMTLDPVTTSPKVIRAFSDAKAAQRSAR